MSPMARLRRSAFLREDLWPCKAMTNTLTPVERTNWALSTWNSTLDRNDVPSAWLYGQGPSVGNSGPGVFTWGALASSLPPPPPPPPSPSHPPTHPLVTLG